MNASRSDEISHVPVDEKDFFREATLRLCSSLDLERALHQCLLYVRRFMPAGQSTQMLAPIIALTCDEAGEPIIDIAEADLARLNDEAVSLIPSAVHAIDEYWKTRRGDVRPERGAPRGGRKVGRNDPCPCGSGRKYKRCCGAN